MEGASGDSASGGGGILGASFLQPKASSRSRQSATSRGIRAVFGIYAAICDEGCLVVLIAHPAWGERSGLG